MKVLSGKSQILFNWNTFQVSTHSKFLFLSRIFLIVAIKNPAIFACSDTDKSLLLFVSSALFLLSWVHFSVIDSYHIYLADALPLKCVIHM